MKFKLSALASLVIVSAILTSCGMGGGSGVSSTTSWNTIIPIMVVLKLLQLPNKKLVPD
jgi:uncharacterized membrane protein